ncbi:MAG: chemotaxis protein CheB [Bryobacteraceae bacterium]|jgi:two-component system CheB/CheR fusion protein
MAQARTPLKPRKTRAGSVRRKVASIDEAEGARPGLSFPVVAIGASAGGLAAFTALLQALPTRSGMAFVLIQHLEPKHESALTTLLSKATSMPVVEVSNGIAVEPNHVYVIPPNKNMTIRKGTLRLAPRSEGSGLQRPIDDFSIALAEEQGNAAIGVVLSGTGSDGTYGLKAIKAAGGVTFAQDPKTAQWPAMPLSAITAGSVDFVLPPKRIAAELARIGRHPYLVEALEVPGGVPEGSDLDRICLLLRSSAGVDFRLYKQATVRRRIARRMALQKIASLAKYAQILKQNPEEAQALTDDIFIHVTSFFRDPECFQALRKRVLAKLCLKRSAGDPIRIWVAGCSTGEEVYSIAMLLLEELGEQSNRVGIQFFGTDIQERAVEHARAGTYPESAVAAVSPARLKRFFVQTDHGYQIQKSIRDLCVFARHDLAKDPPFSRLDLISCRNVLIYMGSALQKRVLSVFQYALKPGGFLFLGNSESIGDYSDAFTADDQKHRIFLRKLSPAAFREIPSTANQFREPAAAPLRTSATSAATDFRREAEDALLEHYAPPALIVDPDLHIVHFQGDLSSYLAPATGQPSFHLLKMVRPELVVDLRAAISRFRKEGVAVHKDGVQFEHQGKPAAVRLEVRPLKTRTGKRRDLLVVFQKVEAAGLSEARKPGGATGKRSSEKTERLERELASTRDNLRSLIAEHETAKEEMKAASEEILSSNEELQSTNEELETAKEELQSSNEELITLNDELQHRNAELNVLTHDLSNLLVGVDIPVLVLDADLRVRRFTPVAGKLLNLILGDVGRPFSNIASTLDVADWKDLFSEVTGQGRLIEREVNDRNGHRYSLRVRPYKTSDNRIEGVLVVMLDTDLIYRARDEAQKSGDYARAIVETIHEALVVVDSECRVLTVNRSFCDLFRVPLQNVGNQSFFGQGAGQFKVSRLRELLQGVLSKGNEIKDFEVDQQFAGIGRRHLVLNAHKVDTSKRILIAIEDFTERKQAQEEAENSQSTIRALLDSSMQSVVAVNAEGKIVLVNGNTEKMFGYGRKELLGQPLEILVPESARARHVEDHKVYFANMKSRPMGIGLELGGRRKDGTVFSVEIGLSAVETAMGKLGVAFVTDITQRKQLERAAQAHAEEVHALAASLLTAQEDERRRVSRELHDQICQQLASLAIDIGGLAADPPPREDAQSRLRAIQARVVKASEETRHIAYELHPSILDDLGLVASLRDLCKQFSERATDIRLKFTDVVLPASVPREVASCLYRVAQESLQNIAKHANAKRALVALTLQKGTLGLKIADDGAGFDPTVVKGRGGLGLIGMEERARLVNGKLSIVSRPGRGTRIALEVPLPSGS